MSSSIRTVTPYRVGRDAGGVPREFKFTFGSMLKDEAISGGLCDAYGLMRSYDARTGAAVEEAVRRDGDGYHRKLPALPAGEGVEAFPVAVDAVRNGAAWLDADGDICLVVPHGGRWLEIVDRRGGMSDRDGTRAAEAFAFDGERRISLIEGDLHSKCVEPVYRVVADDDQDVVRVEMECDGLSPELAEDVAQGRVFRADRGEEAMALTQKIALGRGYRVGRCEEVRIHSGERPSSDVVTPYLLASASRVVRMAEAAAGPRVEMDIEDLVDAVLAENTGRMTLTGSILAAEWRRVGGVGPEGMEVAMACLEEACERAFSDGLEDRRKVWR